MIVIHTLETLPNELLLLVCRYLSWSEMLISLWSLNTRFDSLICLSLSTKDNRSSRGLVIVEAGISFDQCYSKLLPIIWHSSILASHIEHINFDGQNSLACDLSFEWLFEENIFRYPNLKSLVLTRCLMIEPLIQSLFSLIKYQLDELTLTIDRDIIESIDILRHRWTIISDVDITDRTMIMFKQLLRRLFSARCRLSILRLDIGDADKDIDLHECLTTRHNDFSSATLDESRSCCITLRRLNIRLTYACFLEHLIEYVPALERLTVHLEDSLCIHKRSELIIEHFKQSNGTWFDKLPKLQYFSLTTLINSDFEFGYLKLILNKFNYVQTLRLRLASNHMSRRTTTIWNCRVDANFVRRYCLPDIVPNLIDFELYISFSQCLSSSNDIPTIIHSFQSHPLFFDRQWTNVKCFIDPIMSTQYLVLSSIRTPRLSVDYVYHSSLLDWPHLRYVWIDLHPSLFQFLKRFNDLFPHVSWIKVHVDDCRLSDVLGSSVPLVPFEQRQYKLTDIHLQNVTRLDFGPALDRDAGDDDDLTDEFRARLKVVAYIISMPTQLNYLRIEQFIWLLYIVDHASNELRQNALSNVRYLEFSLLSCHYGPNESIRLGSNVVPFLSAFMPRLQTLRIWRPDDFLWTSIRPNFQTGYSYELLAPRWNRSLRTSKSIAQHVTAFERDLCQLVDQLKEFIFLDIRGRVHHEKAEAYRTMVQARFPTGRSDVDRSRFRLWL